MPLTPPACSVDLGARLGELLRPEAFAHRAADIQLRETQPDKRMYDCEMEIALNRRLCPDLYLGIVDVVERAGRLAIGGDGRAVEPAVQMKRLPERGMLANLVERRAADERLMERIACQLADFHTVASSGAGVDEFGSLQTIRANWEENFVQTTRCPGDVLGAAQRACIRDYVDGFVTDNAQLFERRVADHRIRNGHGDLHAGSVCVARRRVYLFDCVEFCARFRCADVAAEVAFLAMDLDHLGRADLACAFVDSYTRRSHDAELSTLLDFYKCYRAFVRGKILTLRLDDPSLDEYEYEHIAHEASAYFDLAESYAAPPAQPLLLVTMGLPASGKTTLARELAGRIGLVHLSSDVLRKRLVGMAPTEHATDPFGGGLYTRRMSQRTYSALRRSAAAWLRRGHSVVVDATYGKPSERAALRQLARRSGALLCVIICRADQRVLKARLAARDASTSTFSDARLELWPALRAAFVEPRDMPEALEVDTSLPHQRVVQQVMRSVRQAGLARRGRTPA